MRLSEYERDVLIEAVSRHFGPHVEARIFGSRADDSARGGDIDVYISGVEGAVTDIVQRKLSLLTELHERLGDQHIDIVIRRRGGPALPIHRRAEATGVRL